MIERLCHSPSQLIRVGNCAKWQRKPFCAVHVPVICDRAERQHQDVVIQRFLSAGQVDSARLQVYSRRDATSNSYVFFQQLFEFRRNVPGLDFAAEVFVQHGLEQKMIFIADKGHFARARQVECGKEAAKAATEDQNARIFFRHKRAEHRSQVGPIFAGQMYQNGPLLSLRVQAIS